MSPARHRRHFDAAIAGTPLGVGIAGAAFVLGRRPLGLGTGWLGSDAVAALVGLTAFAAFAAWFFMQVRRRAG